MLTKTYFLLSLLFAIPGIAEHSAPSNVSAKRWPAWKKFNDFAAFRMAIQETQCQMPGKLLIDSFRMSENSPDLNDTKKKLPSLLKGASSCLQDLKTLIGEGAIPNGVFLMLDKPFEEKQKSIASWGEGSGAVNINLLNPPSLAEMRAFFKGMQGLDNNIQKGIELERTQLACEVIGPLYAHGGITFSGKIPQEHMQMLTRLKALASQGYHLKAETQFVQITDATTRNNKVSYYMGKRAQLMIPANADQESLLNFLTK